jgi:hypothetical protein
MSPQAERDAATARIGELEASQATLLARSVVLLAALNRIAASEWAHPEREIAREAIRSLATELGLDAPAVKP